MTWASLTEIFKNSLIITKDEKLGGLGVDFEVDKRWVTGTETNTAWEEIKGDLSSIKRVGVYRKRRGRR